MQLETIAQHTKQLSILLALIKCNTLHIYAFQSPDDIGHYTLFRTAGCSALLSKHAFAMQKTRQRTCQDRMSPKSCHWTTRCSLSIVPQYVQQPHRHHWPSCLHMLDACIPLETLSLCHVQMKRMHAFLGALWPLWDKVLIWINNCQYQQRMASPQMTDHCCVLNIVAASNHFMCHDRQSASIPFTIGLIVYPHQ